MRKVVADQRVVAKGFVGADQRQYQNRTAGFLNDLTLNGQLIKIPEVIELVVRNPLINRKQNGLRVPQA